MANSDMIRSQMSYLQDQLSHLDELIARQKRKIADLGESKYVFKKKSQSLGDAILHRGKAISRVGDLASRSVSARKYCEHMQSNVYPQSKQEIFHALDEMERDLNMECRKADEELWQLEDERRALENQLNGLNMDLDAALRDESNRHQDASRSNYSGRYY